MFNFYFPAISVLLTSVCLPLPPSVFLLCLFPALRRHLSILRFLCPQTFIFVSTIIVKRGGVGEMKTEKRSKPDHLRRPRVTARLSCLRHKALIASSPIFSPPPFPSLSVSFAVSLSLSVSSTCSDRAIAEGCFLCLWPTVHQFIQPDTSTAPLPLRCTSMG
jgi:hypothetical protein